VTVIEQLASAYNRISEAQQRMTDLAVASSQLIAAAETEMSKARADLDAIAKSLGFTVPGAIVPPMEDQPYPLNHAQLHIN
jgi:hypothetical protein